MLTNSSVKLQSAVYRHARQELQKARKTAQLLFQIDVLTEEDFNLLEDGLYKALSRLGELEES